MLTEFELLFWLFEGTIVIVEDNWTSH